jgi:hypothetical protein
VKIVQAEPWDQLLYFGQKLPGQKAPHKEIIIQSYGSFALLKIDIALPKNVLINTETFYISLPKISLVNFRSNV